MRLSLDLGLGSVATLNAGVGLGSLFGASDDGFLYDPVALASLFQNSAGTTAVTADGDPVAFFNDSSPNNDDAIQATNTSYRPIYRTNSGKPYLEHDGIDDNLHGTFPPPASLTAGIACRIGGSAGANIAAMGGGASATGRRFFLGTGSDNKAMFGWGNESLISAGGSTIRGSDVVLIFRGNATTRAMWVNNVKTIEGASNQAGNGTGGAIAIGGYNNNAVGSVTLPLNGRVYGAFGINRLLSDAEIAFAYSKLRARF